MPETEQGVEQYKQELLDKTNQLLKKIGSTMEYRQIPDQIEGCENLRGKQVLMVDDLKGILELYAGTLTAASGGHADMIMHIGQSVEELSREILDAHPDVVMLDGHLANRVSGGQVADAVSSINPNIAIVITSSDIDLQRMLRDIPGIRGFVEKTSEAVTTLQKVSELV